MNQLLETKVTRTEFLDLILDDMVTELEAQIAPLEKRRDAIPEFDLKTLLPLVPENAEVRAWERHRKLEVRIEFKATPPKAWTEREKLVASINKEIEPLREKLRAIRDGRHKARIELIRRSLESNAEGRQLLEDANALKLTLSRKMLKAASHG